MGCDGVLLAAPGLKFLYGTHRNYTAPRRGDPLRLTRPQQHRVPRPLRRTWLLGSGAARSERLAPVSLRVRVPPEPKDDARQHRASTQDPPTRSWPNSSRRLSPTWRRADPRYGGVSDQQFRAVANGRRDTWSPRVDPQSVLRAVGRRRRAVRRGSLPRRARRRGPECSPPAAGGRVYGGLQARVRSLATRHARHAQQTQPTSPTDTPDTPARHDPHAQQVRGRRTRPPDGPRARGHER